MPKTKEIKREILSRFMGNACCISAFLSACLHTAGSISLSSEGLQFILTTESSDCFFFVKEALNRHYALKTREMGKTNKRRIYTFCTVGTSTRKVLFDLGILSVDEENNMCINSGADRYLIENECCMKSFIQGAFCGAGSFSVSERSGVHLELNIKSRILAEDLCHLIAQFDIFPKLSKRGDGNVIYIKDSQSVRAFLTLVGALEAARKVADWVASHEASNGDNRKNNCLLANLDKSFDAAIRQLEAIQKIDAVLGIDSLPPALQEAVYLRREHPSENLEQLSQLACMSKSGMNHRLRKIVELAQSLKG